MHMAPSFSMHLVSLRLVPLGSFAFLAVGSALVDRPLVSYAPNYPSPNPVLGLGAYFSS